ncbi:MAG: hypothetical protein ABFS05_01195 [Bacteroidota bacterium]
MAWFQWLSIIALFVCVLSCFYHTYRIVRLGKPPEYAQRAGHVGKAVKYAFTGAMSPKIKESAHLHLPTYLAGISYHTGTFLAMFLFFLFLMNGTLGGQTLLILALILGISTLSGVGIFIKRITKKELRSLSNPDDYISNLLVTAFQAITAFYLLYPGLEAIYFIFTALLLFYFPIGKLKHAIYFFAARYHLGLFYGWRGVWPPKPIRK